MADILSQRVAPKASSYEYARAITPSDTVALAEGVCHAIYVGTGGNVAVVDSGGTVTVHVGMVAGVVYPIRALRVNATSTTASNLVAWY